MSNSMEDALNSLFGPRKQTYTIEQIEEAKKRQKKYGGTVLDNLEALAGSSAPSMAIPAGRSAQTTSTGRTAQSTATTGASDPMAEMAAQIAAAAERSNQAATEMDIFRGLTQQTSDSINASIRDLNSNLAKDFGDVSPTAANAGATEAVARPAVDSVNRTAAIGGEGGEGPMSNTKALESFAGLGDQLKGKVFGQDEFIKKLIIAFKRPFVSDRDENDALNSMYITGPGCTGKHYALNLLVDELGKRNVLKSSEIYTMNLALYPSAAEEKLFLQDLYSALQSKSSVIVFENYETCHVSMLTRLSDLVSTGECRLSDRYVMQNGQLINVANALAGNAVGSFQATGKYLIFVSSRSLEKLAGSMGAPFVNALGDVCATVPLNEDALKQIASEQEKELVDKCKKQLDYELSIDESYSEYALAQAGKNRGLQGIINTYIDALKALAELRLERDDLGTDKLTLSVKNDEAVILVGEAPVKVEVVKTETDNVAEEVVEAESAEAKNAEGAEAAEGTEDAEGAKEAEEVVEVTVEEVVTEVEEADPREVILLRSLLPGGYNGELDSVKAEMNSIVGLKEVKNYIYSLEEYYGVQKRRKEAGLKAGEVSKHMIFTGNPGTGKTTIARIVSRYLKAIGVLSGGQLVEVSRADLVGRYVGHTAPLTNQVIKSAIGGVLFIDEAYSLYRGKEDSFGLECIDTLVKGIEDNRDDLIVILAGYSNEMAEFLESNSGLKSRFPNLIDFPDYTGEELLAISRITAKSKGYTIDEGAEAALLAYYNLVQATRARDAGNGRLVRNKVEEAILNQSRRLVAEKDADLSLLTSMDFDLSDAQG